MGRKIERRKPAATAADSAAEDLDVLHPERHLRIGGRELVLREYGHVEWLRLLQRAEPLVASIASMLEAGRNPTYEEALAVIAQHADALMPLVAQAADIAAPELDAMNPEDGELVLMTWWGVNGRFFVQRALNRVAVARAEVRIAPSRASSDMARSTPPSSPTDTTESSSAATPSGS